MSRTFLVCLATVVLCVSRAFALTDADVAALKQLTKEYASWDYTGRPVEFRQRLDYKHFDDQRQILMKLAEIEWTDEAREVILPSAVPITIVREGVRERQGPRAPDRAEPSVKMEEPDVISTDAEGGLESNAEEIRVVAGSARTEMGSENRLDRPEQPAPATADGAPEGSSQGGSAPSVPKRGERPAKD